jgi:hypothetical protein
MNGAAFLVCMVLCIMFGAMIRPALNYDRNMENDQ